MILDTYWELSASKNRLFLAVMPSFPREKKSRILDSIDEDWIPAPACYLPGYVLSWE